MVPGKLKSILIALHNGTITHRDLALLIHYCRSIAECYLVTHRSSILRLCEVNGISLTDLATDIIADIFERNSDGKFVRFERYFQQLLLTEDVDAEQRIFIEFKKFVVLSAKSQLSRTFFQADPTWAKIFRNLKLHLQTHQQLCLSEDFRGFIIEPKIKPVRNDLCEFPLEELEQQMLSQTRTVHTIPEILNTLAEILNNQENYRRSIPLIDIVQIVRKLYVHDINDIPQPVEFELSADEIETIQRMIYRELDSKIFSEYVFKRKISSEEAKILSTTLREIMTSWWSGDSDEASVAEITKKNFNITQKEYKEFYQTKIEYLVRLAKDRVANYLEKNL